VVAAALLGWWTPLQAQTGEPAAPQATGASGVTLRLADLVDRITYTIVDRFEVQLSGLNAATTYEVRVTAFNLHGQATAGPKRATPAAQ